jgi:hypothetical protein
MNKRKMVKDFLCGTQGTVVIVTWCMITIIYMLRVNLL